MRLERSAVSGGSVAMRLAARVSVGYLPRSDTLVGREAPTYSPDDRVDESGA